MNTTIVHLLRHGEVYNPDKILYGRLPGYQLSELGRSQALKAADALADHDLAYLVASPLERAQSTAQPTAARHGLEIATDPALIESFNQFEGLSFSVGNGVLKQPRHWSKLRNPLRPSWGEPYLEIVQRMAGAVYRAKEQAEGREALCVSHQLPIWILRRFLEGRPLWHDPRRRQCEVASLTSLVFSGPDLVDIVYSEPARGAVVESAAK